MGVKASSWAWEQSVTGNTKLVLLALADFADDDGICWPSRKRIAEKCGVSLRAITRQLAHLESLWLIESQPHFREVDGSQSSNRFQLLLHTASPPLDASVQPPGHNGHFASEPILHTVQPPSSATSTPPGRQRPALIRQLDPSDDPSSQKDDLFPTVRDHLSVSQRTVLQKDFQEFWEPDTIDDYIDEAQSYYLAAMKKGKYTDLYACVRGSLRNKAEKQRERRSTAISNQAAVRNRGPGYQPDYSDWITPRRERPGPKANYSSWLPGQRRDTN